MLAPEDENDAEVRREDQDAINRFARLNARKHDIRNSLKDLKTQLEHLEDASTELMMSSGEHAILLQIDGHGSTSGALPSAFMETSEEEATEICEQMVENLQSKVEKLQNEEKEILQEQAKLKSILYGRFGKSINLEDDDDNVINAKA